MGEQEFLTVIAVYAAERKIASVGTGGNAATRRRASVGRRGNARGPILKHISTSCRVIVRSLGVVVERRDSYGVGKTAGHEKMANSSNGPMGKEGHKYLGKYLHLSNKV